MPIAPHQKALALVDTIGGNTLNGFDYLGGMWWMIADTFKWLFLGIFSPGYRLGTQAFYQQFVRIGVRSITIIMLISASIGAILSLQMAPPLQDFGQVDKVANIISVAVLRELGPLISAVVLTGFAGAAIAAELGTMVVGEEIEALEAMALDPVRFLVVPRVIASIFGLMILTVFADVVSIAAGMMIGIWGLDIPLALYWENVLFQASTADFISGVIKGGVFGLLIGLISCFNGLRVTGGAAGVGLATTITVVYSVVSIIFADLLFTVIFYAWGFH